MKKRKLKNFKIGLESEVLGISLVDSPAIESDFLYFSEQKPIYFESNEKKIVCGPVIVPDKPIYRRIDNDEFYVTFGKDVTENLSQKFLKNGFQKNWTLGHERDTNGLSVVESWIKVDMEKDKSVALGLDANLPKGTWFVSCKVDNDDVWNSIKNGEFHGFSIESFVELEQFAIHSEIDEDSFLDKLKSIIKEAIGANVQPQTEIPNITEDTQEVPVEETEVVLPMEEDPSNAVQTEIQNGTPQPIEQPIEQPQVEPTEPQVVEQPVEQPQEEPQPIEQPIEQPQEEPTNEEPKEDNELKDLITTLTGELANIKQQLEELKAENARLASHPSAKPINVNRNTKPMGSVIETIDALRQGTYFK